MSITEHGQGPFEPLPPGCQASVGLSGRAARLDTSLCPAQCFWQEAVPEAIKSCRFVDPVAGSISAPAVSHSSSPFVIGLHYRSAGSERAFFAGVV